MDLEFMFTRQDGTQVSVVGTFDYVNACDCQDDWHVHIEDITFNSVVDELGNNVFLEPYEVLELEARGLDEAYSLLETA